jgi:CBS domain-containing protein
VTDRDLAVKVVAQGRDSKTTTVDEVMTKDPVTCRPEDDVQSALDLMSRHQVRRIPVAEDGNKVVGIISQADLATRIGDSSKIGNIVQDISS